MKSNHVAPIDALTSLRWLFAFYIYLFHIHVRLPLTRDPSISHVLGHGAVGMSFFFILSGFILTHVYYDAGTDYRTYFVRRFARIYPAYFFAELVALLVVPVRLTGLRLAFHWGLNVFSLQGWFPPLFRYGVNGGTWSLTVEWFLYLLFPLFMPVIARLDRRGLFIAMSVLWTLASLPGIGFTLFREELPLDIYYSIPAFRLPEFLVGIVLGCLFRQGVGRQSRFLMPGAALATAACLLYLSYQPEDWSFLVHDWIVVPSIGLVIYACAQPTAPAFLRSRLLVWLGEMSYGFYLFQFAFLYVLEKRKSEGLMDDAWTMAAIDFVPTLAIATTSHYLLERPIRAWFVARLDRRRTSA